MFAKLTLLFAVVAMASAGVLNSYGAPGLGYASPAYGYAAAAPLLRAAAPAYGYGYAAAPSYGYAAATPVYRQAAPALLAAPAITKIAAAPVYAAPAVKVISQEIPQPYSFGYNHQTDDGTQSHHTETSDENNSRHGSYGYTGADGIYRQVDYVADALGYRATIRTNEPGTAPQNPAATQLNAEEPPYKTLAAPAPIVKAVHAPVYAHAAPAVYAHAAPVVKAAIPAYAASYAAPLGHAYAAASPVYGRAYGAYGAAYGASPLLRSYAAPALGVAYHH